MNVGDIIKKLKRIRMLSEFINYKTLRQLAKYIVSGVISVVAEFAILHLLTEYFGVWYIYSNSVAFISAFGLNFFLNKFWAFNSKDAFGKQLGQSIVLVSFNLLASNGIMYLCTDIFNLHYLISKIFAVGAISSWNFVIYKKIIYK